MLPIRLRIGFLALASLSWLFSQQPFHTAALVGWSLLCFSLAPRITRKGRLRTVLILAILSYLAAYKYLPPIAQTVFGDSTLLQFALPLGISYFTFKLLHYVIEWSYGTLKDRSLWSFLCYMFLLPIFTAGPIERFDHFLGNQEPHDLRGNLAAGFTRIFYGLIKKLIGAQLIADLLARLGTTTEFVAGLDTAPMTHAWAFCILTYLYVYLDFSAYTDIALGGSRLFGIRVMENFRWPVVATNIAGFWQRWHLSLSGWCQTYIYLPTLGLSRNTYLALVATFVTIGLWHAGNLSYLCWGLYHGLGMVVYYRWKQLRRRRKWRLFDKSPLRWIGLVPTFLFVASSFAFTSVQAEGIGAGLRLWWKLWMPGS
jgi:alginate O-acetyltransferase complex protein AlgI